MHEDRHIGNGAVMEQRQSGGCLCGAVRFATRGPLRPVIFCHCSQCRKQTGLYYAATSVAGPDIEICGAVSWFAASSFAKRGFCGTCGSALFWKPEAEDRYAVLAGAFDDPNALTPGYHICVASKAGFYEIGDGLPQYAGDGPGVETAAGHPACR